MPVMGWGPVAGAVVATCAAASLVIVELVAAIDASSSFGPPAQETGTLAATDASGVVVPLAQQPTPVASQAEIDRSGVGAPFSHEAAAGGIDVEVGDPTTITCGGRSTAPQGMHALTTSVSLRNVSGPASDVAAAAWIMRWDGGQTKPTAADCDTGPQPSPGPLLPGTMITERLSFLVPITARNLDLEWIGNPSSVITVDLGGTRG